MAILTHSMIDYVRGSKVDFVLNTSTMILTNVNVVSKAIPITVNILSISGDVIRRFLIAQNMTQNFNVSTFGLNIYEIKTEQPDHTIKQLFRLPLMVNL